MKIALFGAGYWGKNLVRVFSQLGVLKTVCDVDEKALDRIKKDYLGLEITKDPKNPFRDQEVTAVVIATPATTHYQLVKESLLAGKHVLVEKPLALNVEEGAELVDIAERQELLLMVGHLLLYHPAIVRLKELIVGKELGDIRYICSNRLNFGKLRREENVLWSFAPHDISMILDIFGELPQNVWALGKSYLQENVPDITLTSLDFKNGRAAHIFVSWLNPFKEQRLSVVGSGKMAVFDGVENTLLVYPHKVEWQGNGFPQAVKADGELINFSDKEPLMEEARHFLECIKENMTPRTDGREALDVLRVLAAAQKSIQERAK